MKKLLTKTFCFIAILSYASISIANSEPCNQESTNECNPCDQYEVCPPCDPCPPCTDVPKTGEPCNCAYNAPARIDPACGWDAWLSGTFLYWQAKEKGLDLGYTHYVEATTPPTISHHDPINMNFDYHCAFKIGIGFSTERDNWAFTLDYKRFNATNTKTKDITDLYDTDNYYLQSIWLGSLEPTGKFSYLKSKWELNYNIFDLEISRPYYLGKKLIFNPLFGIKAGWIDQNYKVNAYVRNHNDDTAANETSKNKQDTWLVGPTAGLKTDWLISRDFRLFGNISSSLSYQRFKNSVEEHIPLQSGIITEEIHRGEEKTGYITPNLDFAIGLGYGSYFYNNEWFFDLTIGYELNYFWNQNNMRHLKDGQFTINDDNAGNLMLHGLNITLRFDF